MLLVTLKLWKAVGDIIENKKTYLYLKAIAFSEKRRRSSVTALVYNAA
jgi:hypothetical protein